MYFIIFILFLISQRLTELYISKRNEKWLLAQGAIEYGREHYPYIVALHALFIISLIVEYYLIGEQPVSYIALSLFILLLIFKYWVLSSLGTWVSFYWEVLLKKEGLRERVD